MSEVCRICHFDVMPGGRGIVAPCACAGSMEWCHGKCMEKWLATSRRNRCEVCNEFIHTANVRSVSLASFRRFITSMCQIRFRNFRDGEVHWRHVFDLNNECYGDCDLWSCGFFRSAALQVLFVPVAVALIVWLLMWIVHDQDLIALPQFVDAFVLFAHCFGSVRTAARVYRYVHGKSFRGFGANSRPMFALACVCGCAAFLFQGWAPCVLGPSTVSGFLVVRNFIGMALVSCTVALAQHVTIAFIDAFPVRKRVLNAPHRKAFVVKEKSKQD
jgi:hypothetical protein